VLNAKIVVGGRVWVWIKIHTHERLWVWVWVEFCLVGMDSRTIYLCTTHPIAIPTHTPSAYTFVYICMCENFERHAHKFMNWMACMETKNLI
jgi:hypothetical protein